LLGHCIPVVAAGLVAMAGASLGCTPTIPVISVEDGRLQARRWDGSPLPPSALVGLELTILDSLGHALRVRVDAEAAPHGAQATYEVSQLDEVSGGWMPMCPDDRRGAIALPGRWRDAGAGPFVEDPYDFTLTCPGGTNGKCASMGYVPGARTRDGEDLTPYFEACVRMLRADYCGDGRSHTEAGVAVEHVDRAGRRGHAHARRLGFEAVWGRRGAVCVRRHRDHARATLPGLAERCPRLSQALGERCREEVLGSDPDALFANRSPEPEPG
jgi:hypothetical protein